MDDDLLFRIAKKKQLDALFNKYYRYLKGLKPTHFAIFFLFNSDLNAKWNFFNHDLVLNPISFIHLDYEMH